MKKKILLTILILIVLFTSFSVSADTDLVVNENNIESIDALVNKVIRESKVPGLSAVIIKGEQSKYLNYGYADKEEKIVTTENTFYEIGSMSKAFTGLGILLLEDEGKISLDDKVSKYLPWFYVKFDGRYDKKNINGKVDITLRNLLYHTSGLPFKTIGDIPEGNSDDMLEKTVRNIVGINIDYYPGEKFNYVTLNYDILGLIIQEVTGLSYEEFIKKSVLKPLGLNDTFLFREEAEKAGYLAPGYKMTLLNSVKYEAPVYRGNTPAGYFYTNIKDMERWMRIQLGLIDVPEQFERIIDKSHRGDTTVASQSNFFYGSGWNIHVKGTDIRHGGSNPTYSSMIIMKPETDMAICILSNLNSNAADYLAQSIFDIIEGKSVTKYKADIYKNLDMVFTITTFGSIIIGTVFLCLLILAIYEFIIKKRNLIKLRGAKIASVLIAVPIIIFLGYCIYFIPNVLFERLSWHAVNVWGSSMITTGCITCFIACIIFMLYILFTFNFQKANEKNYLSLIALSLINGISSAMIIFTINESFNRNLEYSKELLIYFAFALMFYIYTYKLLQGRLIVITNELTYEKRINMINKILCSSYQSIEIIGRDRIFSGLNNDCTAVAQFPELMVAFASNFLTLIFCLIYLLSNNMYAFLASLAIIVINGVLYIFTSKAATKYWEQNRDIQDTYFEQMTDLINGFKELILNKARRFAFWLDLKKFSRLSTELNKVASIKFLNFKLYNITLYNIVFGVVVFVFPLLVYEFRNDVNQLRENLFIVFYMIGPFGAVIATIPQLTKVRVNFRRINKLIEELEDLTSEQIVLDNDNIQYDGSINLKLTDVTYSYKAQSQEDETQETEFTLGPISAEFKSGELTFITGGNGSGKATLGRIITGLYLPESGTIENNGEAIELTDLNQLFSSVFNDYNLFKKLYGIDHIKKKDEIDNYLEMMDIKKKVELDAEGKIKSINLSTGQKKRLAFIISCLEDKPMLIFDEWAAEQDPQFRHYFYEKILPMLRAKGKGVIVITHDDRYFYKADKLIKLERGVIVDIQ